MPDSWETKQGNAVKHVLNTFSILDAAQFQPQLHSSTSHATIHKDEIGIDVVAVLARSHEECDKHVMDLALNRRGPLLIVSRDDENTTWNSAFGSFLTRGEERNAEFDITDPRSAVIHLGFQDLLNAVRGAADQATLRELINDSIS
ncbi:hypothetical protein BMR85_028255 [Achromobacter sp. KAs 3-5]|nr:hypothetical protein BMR85_028255 [Achromobacter sp. KAs 3-5]